MFKFKQFNNKSNYKKYKRKKFKMIKIIHIFQAVIIKFKLFKLKVKIEKKRLKK